MIDDLLRRIGKADDIDSVDALTRSVEVGTIPAFIGVPMIAELVRKQKAAQALAAGAPQTTVTDQVMQQAQLLNQPQQPMPYQMAASDRPPIPTQVPPQNPMPPREMVAGIDAAQSNLPTRTMAGGGIVAFAGGNLVDADVEYDPFDDEDNEEYYADMDRQSKIAQLIASQEASSDALTQDMLDSSKTRTPATPAGIASNAGVGVKFRDPIPTGGSKGMAQNADFIDRIRYLESRGRDYDDKGNILTSPKGAMGSMQTMPNTLRDPGFGVKPAQDSSVAEMNRVGRDYANAMLKRYGNEKDAAMAYNWGPGSVDAWIAGGRKGPVPGETRQYASNFAEGGIVKLASGGKVPGFAGGVYITDSAGTTRVPNYPMVPYQDPNPPKTSTFFNRPSIDDLLNRKMPAGPQNPFGKAPSSAPAAVPGIRSLLPRSADEYTNIFPTGIDAKMFNAADASYLNQLLIESQKDPSYQPIKDEIAKLLKKNPGLAKVVEEQNIKANDPVIPVPANLSAAPEEAPKKSTGPMTEEQLRKSQERFNENKQGLFPATPEKTAAPAKTEPLKEDPQAKAEETLFNEMRSAFKKREAALESEKSIDNYLSVLQGFLGMMSGTSPYAMVNIGQGASSGINTLLAARKQTGLAERALGRDQASLLTAQNAINRSAADRALREKLGMAKLDEAWADNLAAAQKARQLQFDKLVENDVELKFSLPGVTKRLNDAAVLKKDPDPKDVAEYNRLMQKRQGYVNMLETKIPDPVRPGAGSNFAGFSATKVTP
jgi:hypothetical protein